VEALISILEAAFGDPDQVGTASAELDKLTQGNKEFSQYHAEFQYLMAILEQRRLPSNMVFPKNSRPASFTSLKNHRILRTLWIFA
jgi:hypothetical protein